MKKIYLLLCLSLSVLTAFSQGSIINGTVFNDEDGAGNGMNGNGTLPITLYAHLVHEKNGNPNDLEVINSTQISSSGAYSINSAQHQFAGVAGFYKIFINKYAGFPFSQPFASLPASWLTTGTLPAGWVHLADYNGNFGNNTADGISGSFPIQQALCTGEPGDPAYDECMNGGGLRRSNVLLQIDNANFSVQQSASNSVTFSSDSPKCAGQTISFNVVSSIAETPTYTITGPNNQTIIGNQISNTTPSQSGIYTITGSFLNGDTFTETTNVFIQPMPTINFISGETNLNLNPADTFYGVDVPLNSIVTYTISPSNAGSISSAELNTLGGYVLWNNTFVGEATITAEYTNNCGTATATRLVNVIGPLVINLNSNSPKCEGQTINFSSILFGSTDAYTLSGPQGVIAGTSISNISAAQAGTYTITMTSTGFTATAEVVVNQLPPNIVFTTGATSLPFNPNNEFYQTNAPNGYMVSYSLSPQSAGTISNTGELNVNDTFRGSLGVIASISNTCGTKTATRNIDIPLYEITSNSPVCEGESIIFTLQTNPGPNAGFELEGPKGFVLDDGNDLTISIPNAQINDAGAYTLTAFTWLGSALVNVVVNPLPPNIAFTAGAITLPINSPNTTYTTDAPNTYTVSYTISPQNAGTIDANGIVNWDDNFTGQATITASITNSCGVKTATRLVEIAPLPAEYKIGNTVFFDQNKNGIQDNGEIGISGLTVKLYQADGVTQINSTTTDNVGNYIFENLPAGDYIVGVIPNSQFTVSSNDGPNIFLDNQIDLDDNGIQISMGAEAKSSLINLSTADGTGDLTIDFGFHMPTPLNSPATITSNSPVCEEQTLILTVGDADPALIDYSVTGPNGVVNNLSISNVSISQAGTYTITSTNVSDGSPVGVNSISVVVNPLPPSITFTSGAITLPINSPNTTYTTDAPNTFTVTNSISPQTAGTISTAGVVTWANCFSGQVTITASISNSCGTKTVTREVTITGEPLTIINPVITSNSPVCEGQPLNLLVTGDIDGSIILDYTITGPNGQIISSPTFPNATLAMAGNYTLTGSLGCLNYSVSTNVVVNPLPYTITFTSGATNLDQNSPNEIYTTNAPIGSPLVFSLSPVGAGTIIVNSGEVDWNASFFGEATIKFDQINDCFTNIVTRTVTINKVSPVITCPPNILVPVADGITSAVANFTLPTIAGATVSQISGLVSGSNFPFGNTTIVFEATNTLGNTASCSFIVAVYPENAPTVQGGTINNATPDPNTGNFSISDALFDITIPSGEIITGLLIASFPEGAESITINGITYGPPAAPNFVSANSKIFLVTFPIGGIIAATNDNGQPDEPILINPKVGTNLVEIEFVAINGSMQQSPIPAIISVNFISGPLPITLLNFLGKSTKGNIILSWQTTNESNFSHFEIEKSSPLTPRGGISIGKFEKIGQIAGNQSEIYEFLDITSPPRVEWLYRLRLVDFDGKFSYSKIISVQNETETTFKIYPNPATNYLIVSNIKPKTNYFIMNNLGQILQKGIVDNSNPIEVSSLKAGIYFVNVGGMVRKFLKE